MIFPKKPQILYAPMLATFGGGSANGFRSSGSSFVPFHYRFDNGNTLGRFAPSSYTSSRITAYDASEGPHIWAGNSSRLTYGSGYIRLKILYAGTYRLKAGGASQRANRDGGHGAYIQGDFTFTENELIEFTLGQQSYPFDSSTGAGGGGTFSVRYKSNRSNLTNSDILIIAGGGGGAHNEGRSPATDGQAGMS